MEWLLRAMSGYANRQAMVHGERAFTYADLLERYQAWSGAIREHGIRPGEVVSLEGDYSPSVCGAILALLSNRNIIVPMSAGVRHRRDELADIAQVDRSLDFDGPDAVIRTHARSGHSGLLEHFIAEEKPGLVLFTSGTTGRPKAILHDVAAFLERYKTPRDTLRTLTFLLFDHIGGLNTMFHTLANGGTIIAPDSRTAPAICALIERHRIELLPASPSFLNLLLMSGVYRNYDLSSLRIITYGTEVMPDSTLQAAQRAFPEIQLRQTYGLSELGILRAKSRASGSPWLRIGGEGVETRIVDGMLHIRSGTAMRGYLNAPHPFDEEGWFNTQDEVLADGEYIRILGRRSEVINVGGRKVYPVEVEDVLLQMPEVADAAVRGEPNPLMGSIVIASVNLHEPFDPDVLKARIRSFCRGKLEDYQIPVKIEIRQGELYTERYKKIRREQLPSG
ncbi:class I adenylate-forming enzyme family protein [Paenibacillus xanthanilyticus]|uniref:Class I adenylate-forming enzyme family protein n=1 Tax=Paenibacillus xanthanilyticus TaxID=1783531 RepID=A0ABV8K974_9BACL